MCMWNLGMCKLVQINILVTLKQGPKIHWLKWQMWHVCLWIAVSLSVNVLSASPSISKGCIYSKNPLNLEYIPVNCQDGVSLFLCIHTMSDFLLFNPTYHAVPGVWTWNPGLFCFVWWNKPISYFEAMAPAWQRCPLYLPPHMCLHCSKHKSSGCWESHRTRTQHFEPYTACYGYTDCVHSSHYCLPTRLFPISLISCSLFVFFQKHTAALRPSFTTFFLLLEPNSIDLSLSILSLIIFLMLNI